MVMHNFRPFYVFFRPCLTEFRFFLGCLYVLAFTKYFSGGCSLSYGGWLLVSQIASNKPSDSEGFLLSFYVSFILHHCRRRGSSII